MDKTKFIFKESTSLELRKEQSLKMKERCPDKIPVVLEKYQSGEALGDDSKLQISQTKFLVPVEFTFGKFLQIVRARMQQTSVSDEGGHQEMQPLDKRLAIYIFFKDNKLQKMDTPMAEIAARNVDADGFLYAVYTT